MREIFGSELQKLHTRFSEMGMMVNEAIYNAVKAFVDHDRELAQNVINNDNQINAREVDLEQRSFEMIALQQPVTSDLRMIVTIMKASSDLERMGDHAVSIARSTIRVKGNPRVPEIEADIAKMARFVEKMVAAILDAYVKTDAKKAKKIAGQDKKVNQAFQDIYTDCIKQMQQSPETVVGSSDYMMVASYLERIGDYVTNLSEWIIYLKTNKIVELNNNDNERM
ncbi:phosphate transport system regulatory protein PhoU [Loigolactobacillus backii]|uniref:phosphate signaling complex protein PhoU n=1 Tax=Loigolactobacillus backii TaxID=375175 RepID=UPI0007F1585A|nr:phosphate signaling complex protein PhoU [Loigolactobacillus backii]ANK59982.1 phosphate transport system regulatory protein PhoU [Loigolactobacillus backii]ANK64916.1 phosphate transport system regulatory protein PhoU [Loigolactobacillus backii]ANK66637.1 phosphate transport system regulatory protein PhoU [Loigolactobacillus backii]OLF70857.1 PhoU family transcriptional regulator [Loigolactobacillus backii]PIO87351.1 phosphate transport system regulatory protein PhoU [Loigolactobacillus ba